MTSFVRKFSISYFRKLPENCNFYQKISFSWKCAWLFRIIEANYPKRWIDLFVGAKQRDLLHQIHAKFDHIPNNHLRWFLLGCSFPIVFCRDDFGRNFWSKVTSILIAQANIGHIIWPSLSICGVRWISILIYRTSSNRLRLYEFIELTWGKIGDHRLDTSNIWGERFITPPSQRHFEKGFTKAGFQIDALIPVCDWLMRLMLQSYWRGAPPS